MSWFYWKILFVSLGITIGMFLAYQGYKYFLASGKKSIYVPRIILHSLEGTLVRGEVLFNFELKSDQRVKLEICNMHFEPVMVLFEKELTEGAHTHSFDTGKLTDGTYFYRLTGDQQQVMKKMQVANV